MQLAPSIPAPAGHRLATALRATVEPATASSEPAGWSPGAVAPALSSRGHGLLRGALDAWRGVPETSLGAALTQVQVDTLAPFLAGQLGMVEAGVRRDLAQVRIQTGGLAYDVPDMATTVGPNIYVADASYATRMLSWGGRAWLAHELVHTMQWRRIGDALGLTSDAARDRAFLNRYVGSFASHDGRIREGGFVQAARELLRRHRDGTPMGKVGDVVHDTHPMEREAIKVAATFAASHPT
jgi:hypothetical protein